MGYSEMLHYLCTVCGADVESCPHHEEHTEYNMCVKCFDDVLDAWGEERSNDVLDIWGEE